MHQSVTTTAHCINPACPRPYPQDIGNKFCNVCGSSLRLKNRYIPLQQLGIGGFAAIYTVWDLQAKTQQVLKVLLESSPKALAMFEQEARVLEELTKLRHPGVPKVEKEGYFQVILGNSPQRLVPCLVMEKIVGQTLEDIVRLHPQGCPQAWVLGWLKQAVEILRELHLRNIIHRDIKPSNLMLRQETGQLVLIDFGGAKQIGPAQWNSQASSTRLFSPGYSPPEQIAGGMVGPSADFYALGMTCIQLLTGKYPLDLENPKTGEFNWHPHAKVHPALAVLLDDMVQPNIEKRPANTREIFRRLREIYANRMTLKSIAIGCGQILGQGAELSGHILANSLKLLLKGIKWFTFSFTRLIVQILKGCFCTILAMIWGGIGAAVGALIGFLLAQKFPDIELPAYLIDRLPELVATIAIAITKPQMILFAIAGFGTAWGLTIAKSFGQPERRYLVAGTMGAVGYVTGWSIVQRVAPNTIIPPNDLVSMTVAASFLLTLGLGLPSHNTIHSIVAALGTGIIFASLVNLAIESLPLLAFFGLSDEFFKIVDWTNIGFTIGFFTLFGVLLAFWLGVSSYLFVPLIKKLGWR